MLTFALVACKPDIEGGTELEVFASVFNNAKIPILRAVAYPESGMLRVAEAWTGHDRTASKLYTNEIILAAWLEGGFQAADLRELQVDDVTNIDTVAAARVARKEQGKDEEPLDVTKKDGSGWDAMVKSPFGKVAGRVAQGVSKEISRISLGYYRLVGEYGKKENNVRFYFA
ncbi:hypothetical protein CTRI78_v006784 [Colletotrichum trifolii]|uniref:Uncharacterized protein n=1 Tax=Colletotrichum trifolii TaxID=5466 RepID=A0A4R8RBL8_COLTR|nr:hypothetical protein CTRI78_v006784 [Colletotrichum trifolii]